MSLAGSTSRAPSMSNAVAGPSTPRRGFRDSVNNAGTATPSRRMTLTPSRVLASPSTLSINGTQHSLPDLNFPPLSTRIVAESSKLKQEVENGMHRMDATLRAARERKSEKRRAHDEMRVELLEEERRWEQECERLRKAGADVVKAMEREKLEIADATTKLTAIEDRRRALARQLEAIRSETEEVSMKVAEFQDRNKQDRAAFARQADRDEPELAFLEETLGLQMEGKARDVVSFTFTFLDPSDHKRAFTFDLDVSESDYSIPFTRPTLSPSVLRALLATINEKKEFGNFAAFVQGVRQAFVDLVQAEARASR